ncbi:response regulator transcription factor [uncultured Corynebacterium sp.]|uniref:response regulator n=1 Tax=uncultured Corynebacterium sp. TaxID=159447 RepID=UPI002599105F|nr:response regulator transcription factor [uncultured Corynebacterium sp.]
MSETTDGTSGIRVLIADDHPVVRAGLEAMISAFVGIDVVATADTAKAAVDYVAGNPQAVDVVLMDLRFGDAPHARSEHTQDGVWATSQIRAKGQRAPHVVVVTNYSTDADVVAAISAGAQGYLLKDCQPADLREGIRAAARGESIMNPRAMDALMGSMRTPTVTLTAREVEVLERVALGESNRQIARALALTEATVKSHMGNIFTKLGVSNRTSAVNSARERGLV